jgi:hypothetical protein
MSNSFLHIETFTSQPIKVKDSQIRLRSQVIQFRLPIGHGGLIWNRPTAVLVHTADGQDHILPVLDVTRIAVLALITFSFISTFLFMRFRRKTD